MHTVVKIPTSTDREIEIHGDCGPLESVDIAALMSRKKHFFFVGHMIVGNRFVSNAQEFDRYLRDVCNSPDMVSNADGAFAACFWWKDKLYHMTDVNSLESAFLYRHEAYVYISTSFLLLVEKLIFDKIGLSANKLLIERFLRTENVYDTLFCNSTMVEGVDLIPYNVALQLEYVADRLRINENRLNTFHRMSVAHSYEELLEAATSKIMAKLDLASKLADVTLLSLSGGSDSRVLYATAKRMGLKDLYILTGGKNGRDREVAEIIARVGGDTLHYAFPRRRTLPVEPAEALRRYELANLGVYSFFVVSQVNVCDPYEVIEIRGGGALRAAYASDGRDLSGLTDLRDDDVRYFCKDLPRQFGNLDWKDMHYLSFRNRIHIGRNHSEGRRVACRFDPLQTPELQVAASLITAEQRHDYKIYCDMLLMLNPIYAFLEFDKAFKKFGAETLRNSSYLGIEKDIRFTPIDFDQHTRSVDGVDGCTNDVARDWMPEFEFDSAVDDALARSIDEFLPSEYRHLKGKVLKAYMSGVGARDGRGRQISKLYSIARLSEIGVSF